MERLREYLLIAFCVPALTAMAADDRAAMPALKLVAECPKTGAPRACLTMRVQWVARASKQAIYRKRRAAEPLLVRGRLAGGDARVYRLAGFNGHAAGAELGSAAYFGRTAENRPIVLTDRGPLEIEARFVDVDEIPAMIMVDERNWRVVASYLSAAVGEYVVNGPHDVAVWDYARDVCIVAPRRRPGPLVIDEAKCKAREPLGIDLTLDGRITGNLATETERVDRQPAQLGFVFHGDAPVTVSDGTRIRGTRFMMVQLAEQDYCGTDIEPDHPFEPLDRAVDWTAFRE